MAKEIEATPILKGQDLLKLIEDAKRTDRGQKRREFARELLRKATDGRF